MHEGLSKLFLEVLTSVETVFSIFSLYGDHAEVIHDKSALWVSHTS